MTRSSVYRGSPQDFAEGESKKSLYSIHDRACMHVYLEYDNNLMSINTVTLPSLAWVVSEQYEVP